MEGKKIETLFGEALWCFRVTNFPEETLLFRQALLDL